MDPEERCGAVGCLLLDIEAVRAVHNDYGDRQVLLDVHRVSAFSGMVTKKSVRLYRQRMQIIVWNYT